MNNVFILGKIKVSIAPQGYSPLPAGARNRKNKTPSLILIFFSGCPVKYGKAPEKPWTFYNVIDSFIDDLVV